MRKLRVSGNHAPIVLLMAICLVISLAIISVASASSRPTLTLTQSEGPGGTLVGITGTNFDPNKVYRVYFDRNNNERWDAGETYRTVRSDAEGKFSTTLTIPSVLSGNYYIRADEPPYAPPAIASALFTVKTVYEKLLDLEGILQEIEGKLDALELPEWGDIISKNLEDVVSAIWAADIDPIQSGTQTAFTILSEIKNSIDSGFSSVNAKLDGATSLLQGIKSKVDPLPTSWPEIWGDVVSKNLDDVVSAIREVWASDIGDVKDEIQKALNNLLGIKQTTEEINTKLGRFNVGDTVASLLYDIKVEVKTFTGQVENGGNGGFTIDPTFNPPTQPISVNYVTGSGTGKIDGEEVSFSVDGYLISDWGHYIAMNKGAIVTGWLRIDMDGSYIYARVEGMQHEVHRYGSGQTQNELICTFEIITGTGPYSGATGSGTITAIIDTKYRTFSANFEGVIVLR